MTQRAVVTFQFRISVECSDELMARMLDSSDEGMGPFYPSENRWEAFEKLARWGDKLEATANQLDGIADFPADAFTTKLLGKDRYEMYTVDEEKTAEGVLLHADV